MEDSLTSGNIYIAAEEPSIYNAGFCDGGLR